jgi:hypothetical protein
MQKQPIVMDTVTAKIHLVSYLLAMEGKGIGDSLLAHRVRNMINWIDMTFAIDSNDYADPKTLKHSNELLRQCYDICA